MFWTGTHGHYRWLTTDEDDLDTLLRECPQVFGGRYIVITSLDSGSYFPTDEEKAEGWEMRNGITYTPRIEATGKKLPTGGFDEWYVFNSPIDLGQLRRDNPFEATLTPGQVWAFVNYGGFALHDHHVDSLLSAFWKQFDWIEPEFYVADGYDFLTFASRNEEVFAAVRQALQNPHPEA